MPDQTVSELLTLASAGNDRAAGRLFEKLYGELHRLARRELRRLRHGDALSPTTLLHEAYVSMTQREGLVFTDRNQFMSYAAQAMRGLIVDNARRRCARKRGGDVAITALRTEHDHAPTEPEELVRIGEALEVLAQREPELARIVDLKFFCGFDMDDIAGVLGLSRRTVTRKWEKARILLFEQLSS
jgi:RNA polymerase sigma factor (TIGR02999 family)